MGIFNKLFNNKKKPVGQEEIDEAIEAMEFYKDISFRIYNELIKHATLEFKVFLVENKQDAMDFLMVTWVWLKKGLEEDSETETIWSNIIAQTQEDQKLVFKTWVEMVAGDKLKKTYNKCNEKEKSYLFGLWHIAVCLVIDKELPTKS